MVTIKAAVFRDDSEKPSLEKLELTGPGDGEVLVKIVATDVCVIPTSRPRVRVDGRRAPWCWAMKGRGWWRPSGRA